MGKPANTQETRHDDGKFRKGVSGNPNGRPKIPQDVIDAARAHTETAISTLAQMCTSAEDEKVRVQAAEALLNRAWGKPTERQEVSGPNGGPIKTEAADNRPAMTPDDWLKSHGVDLKEIANGVGPAARAADKRTAS